MGSGWSQTSYCQDEDFNMTRIRPDFSSNGSSDSSDSSSESEKSASSTNVTVSEEKPKNVTIVEEEKVREEEPKVEPLPEPEPLPPMTPEMMMLGKIRKATAARDEKEHQIRSVVDLYNSLQSQVYQMNYDLVLANQQYTCVYGKNAVDEMKKYELDESTV